MTKESDIEESVNRTVAEFRRRQNDGLPQSVYPESFIILSPMILSFLKRHLPVAPQICLSPISCPRFRAFSMFGQEASGPSTPSLVDMTLRTRSAN